jgi:hypothetical protein
MNEGGMKQPIRQTAAIPKTLSANAIRLKKQNNAANAIRLKKQKKCS